uniref:Ice-binding protein C-terminal domain-containing protein n=1 Tax=uncultured bacterium CSL132 TaxID=1091568 RepID=G4WVJ5_9BACT|nr:PEP-CTERM motif protein of unknown function DUF1555 [uncultured bacterium CSL132]
MFKKKLISTLGVAVGLALSGASSAATITNLDNTFNFGGFDWASAGTAFTTGFAPVATTAFTLTYFSQATAITFGGNPISALSLPHMDTVANGVYDTPPLTAPSGYEYTIVATVNETVVGCVLTSCTFNVTGGTFNIYYDLTSNANMLAGSLGTGFNNGTVIIGGTINGGTQSTFDTANGSNSTTLQGTVTTTNNTFVNPNLVGTTATTTLQIGNAVTDWTNPGGFNGAAFTANNIVFQADANESFTQAVPEPGSLALLGAAFLGFFGLGRRRNKLA